MKVGRRSGGFFAEFIVAIDTVRLKINQRAGGLLEIIYFRPVNVSITRPGSYFGLHIYELLAVGIEHRFSFFEPLKHDVHGVLKCFVLLADFRHID